MRFKKWFADLSTEKKIANVTIFFFPAETHSLLCALAVVSAELWSMVVKILASLTLSSKPF